MRVEISNDCPFGEWTLRLGGKRKVGMFALKRE